MGVVKGKPIGRKKPTTHLGLKPAHSLFAGKSGRMRQ